MALAVDLAYMPLEVLAMQVPMCPRHRRPMIEVQGADGCYRCPRPDCEMSKDLMPGGTGDGQAPPPGGGRPALYVCKSVNLRGQTDRTPPDHWLSHIGIHWPLLPVRQSNASDDFSILAGPVGRGRGGRKSGRRHKKQGKGGKSDGRWAGEGGTNHK